MTKVNTETFMKHLLSTFFILLTFVLQTSCADKSLKRSTSTKDSLSTTNTTKIVSALKETLIPSAKKETENWIEYKTLDDFLINYYAISKSKALLNAKELVTLVKQLKDTIRVEKLNKPSVLARINTLENEVLRLEDMATISAITFNEVAEEVKTILTVYEAFKAKINTIYKAEALQEALDIDTEKTIPKVLDKK